MHELLADRAMGTLGSSFKEKDMAKRKLAARINL